MNMMRYVRTDPTLPYRDSIMNGSRKESALSPQSFFSSENEYIPSNFRKLPESSKGIFLTELSGESNFHELPDTSLLPELPEDCFDHDQPTPVAGHSFCNNQKPISSKLRIVVPPRSLDIPEACSTVVTELPCVDNDQIGSRAPWYIESQEPISMVGDCLSDAFGLDTSAEVGTFDTTAGIRNQIDAACLSPESLISMPHQSPRFRGSMCPAIRTDVRRFGSNFHAIQHQRRLSENSFQISSPDTASTSTSGETFPSDSGYDPRALQSDYTSATSPKSFFPGDERLGFENTSFSKAGQLVSPSEIDHEKYLQSKQPNDCNLFGLATIQFELDQFELDDVFRDQQMQASCLSDFKEDIFESGEMGVINNYLAAYIAQSATDIDQRLPNNFPAGDVAQYLQSTIHCGVDCLKNIMPGAEKCAATGAATFTPAMETENQYDPNFFGTYEEKHASPWSAENIRGFNKNFNFATIPETQLPIEEEQARSSTHDTPSPKSDNKVLKCSYPDCTYKPGGKDQWRIGNLRRHEKEHKITLKDRIVCKMRDCKATFTRAGNRDAHLENMHGALIQRQRRNRRNSMTENTKKPRTGNRIAKTPRKVGGLTNRPKQNRSQSVPEILKNTEF
ncbi:hypothetical protein EAE96_005357 [Botrytis aclada]|nr:hypothetical protein EAE96_005357 [Botrytis aclada]